ncbi:MAG: SlyX family protein [Planctomycetota bacterium]|nr:SlyX family protein [Planctomycetota bacterium]
MNESNLSRTVEQRVIALEESVMHLERMLKQLDGVVCSIQDRLDKQDEALNHLTEVIRGVSQREPEKRTLEDDRPPHY